MTDRYEIWPIDCRQAMQCMEPNSLDSCVTDPPYELTSIVKRFGADNAAPAQYRTDGAFQRASKGFMGKQWDGSGVAFDPATWREVYRVLKPGAHLLAFSGSRTYHRMVCAIEDAGFEIRDQIMWVYGSGFPKSLDVSKAIDKRAGAEREVLSERVTGWAGTLGGKAALGGLNGAEDVRRVTAPATPQAEQWQGWGTALKPAHEPIVVARKPLVGSVAENVLMYGTGGINIDGCRIGTEGARNNGRQAGTNGIYGYIGATERTDYGMGRFPANFIHDGSDEVLAGFPITAPSSTGNIRAVGSNTRGAHGISESFADRGGEWKVGHGDSGSAARFFYCAKASRADRNSGCEGLPEGMPRAANGSINAVSENRGSLSGSRANIHPTVKPEPLMRYLTRLVTPLGGRVLDPFAGSGSTGKAAIAEGFYPVLCEMTDEYLPILQARIDHAVRIKAGGQ